MICSLIGWAIFGLIVGGITRLIWPGPQGLGLTMTMLLGIAGSVVGGYVTHMLFGGPDNPYHPGGWIMSIVGAILVLWIAGMVAKNRPPAP